MMWNRSSGCQSLGRSLVALGATLSLAIGFARPSAANESSGVQPKEVTLDNGLKLLLIERHEQPTVACGLFFDVGSVNDPRGQSGIAHLFEHMLFKGTRRIGTDNFEAERPLIQQQDALRAKMNDEFLRMREMKRRGEISDVLDPDQWTDAYRSMKKEYDAMVEEHRKYIKNNELFNLYTTNGGAGLNAGTSEDVTMYFVQLPSNKLELFFWLESDRMVNGVMREFYVERDNVREERRLRTESTPTGKYNEAFEALFWQSHPYGVPVLGWASEVESITRDDVRDFYRRFYAPNNATLVLVGDFKTDEAVQMAQRYFGSLKPSGDIPPPVVTEEPRPIAERRFYAEAETNPRVRVRFHTVAMGHRDEAALDVLAELLSGRTGRLFKRLVTEEDVAIGQPRANNNSRKYAGYFEINVTVKEGHDPAKVERMVLSELDKLRVGEITARELQRVKNQVLASSVQRIRSNFGLMFQLGLYETFGGWEYINESPSRMLDIEVDDVRRVLDEYFDPSSRTVAIYTTKEGGGSADPEMAALMQSLPPHAQEQVRMLAKRIESNDDVEELRTRQTALQGALESPQVPKEQRPIFEFMLRRIQERIEELERGAPVEPGKGGE